jgi:hypothetical protein
MLSMIQRVRAITRVIDARPLTRLALATGAAVSWVATPLVARAVHLSASWIPAAVSATAGWFMLVALAVTVWEVVEILRKGPDILLAKHQRHNWPRGWIPPVLLVVGILVGWWLFT